MFCSVLGTCQFYPYPSGLLYWHGHCKIACPCAVKQPWKIWVNKSYESAKNWLYNCNKMITIYIVYGIYYTSCKHWNGNVILMKFPSLAALKVVKVTTFSAASDENFIKITFPFQWTGMRFFSIFISNIYQVESKQRVGLPWCLLQNKMHWYKEYMYLSHQCKSYV